MSNILHMHLVSDASGETVNAVSSAVISQFEGIHIVKHFQPLVRSFDDVERVLKNVQKHGGIVIQTMIKDEMLQYLRKRCDDLNVICFSPIDELTNIISRILGITPTSIARTKKPALGKEYFRSVENMNFTINHDDGKRIDSCKDADIIILGVSRVSKTPISLYIAAHYGYRVANIPITQHFTPNMQDLAKTFKVGLITSPQLLAQVRCDRADNMRGEVCKLDLSEYSSFDKSREDIASSIKIFREGNIPIFDVSYKSIEETAAEIIKSFYQFNHKENVVDIVL